MLEYRLYRLHPQSGHFIGVEEMQAADNAAAIRATNARHPDVATELWCGGHKVARFDARPVPVESAPRDQSPGRASP
jgi:hypothetical protein